MTELIKKVQAEIDNHEKVQSDFEYHGYRELIDYEPLKTLKALRVALEAIDIVQPELEAKGLTRVTRYLKGMVAEIKQIMGVGDE